MYNEKRKAIKLTAIVLVVLTIFAAIFAAIYFGKQDAPVADKTLNVETENGFDNTKTYAMPKTMAFTAKSLAAAQANGQTVDVKIKASVSPWDAANQAVDYSIAWGVAPTHGKEAVTDYVTVTQDADGSLTATISCKKAFDSDKIIVIVTTRDGGYTAKCTVSFVGVANSIVINNSTLNPISDSKRGVYYQLGTNKIYNFDIALDNIFGKVGSQNLTVTLGGSGELYFGDEFVSGDSGMGSFSNMAKRKMSDMVNKFITSATISGNTLTLKTGSTVIENYYDENKPIRIKADPSKSPSQNAQKYFKEYRKAKTAEQLLTGFIEESKQELAYLETVADSALISSALILSFSLSAQ